MAVGRSVAALRRWSTPRCCSAAMESGALPGAGDPGLGGGRGPRPRCSGAAFDAAACAFLCGLAVAVLAFVRGCAGATCRSTLMAGATNSRIHVSRPPRPAPLVPRPAPAPRRPSPTVVSAAVDPSALPPAPSPATQAARAFFYGELYPSLDPSRAAALAEADAAAHVEGLGEGEHLYGEVTFDSLAGLLRAVAPEPGAVFLDLGSGCGRAVFTAALTQPFRECRGVELLPSLFEESTKALRIYNAKVCVARGRAAGVWRGHRVSFVRSPLPRATQEQALLTGNYSVGGGGSGGVPRRAAY